MDNKFLNTIAPIVKDKFGWDAFLAIIEYEQFKLIKKLAGPNDPEELLRINGQYTLLEKLKKLKDNAEYAKRELSSN